MSLSATDKTALVVEDVDFRAPRDLAVTPTNLRHVIVIGSCLAEPWPHYLQLLAPGCETHFVFVNNMTEFPEPPCPLDQVDFQIIQIPLSGFFPEHVYTALRFDDLAGHETLFKLAVERLRPALQMFMRWNRQHSLLTFVTNFMVPQQNPMGRLLPRYDLRNPLFFVEELNRVLVAEVSAAENAYVVDIDHVSASLGKRYIQDDVIWRTSHAASFTDFDFELDQSRIEPPQRVTAYYPSHVDEFLKAAIAEILAAYRSVRQIDGVKLVVVDLDDTLWRGVAAEMDSESWKPVEGWPLGFIEALCFLKKRGILLAIVSKNDESRIEALWDLIFMGMLSLEDFAVRKINWKPKAENLALVLQEVSLLPKSVVFIDDNPVERAALEAGFPDLRTLGSEPYLLRRILLWFA